jgi:hypothetical protein
MNLAKRCLNCAERVLPAAPNVFAPSRGRLPADLLHSSCSPLQFLLGPLGLSLPPHFYQLFDRTRKSTTFGSRIK